MIYNAETRLDMTFIRPFELLEQRMFYVHRDLTNIAAHLRNSAGVEVWTEVPSDDTGATLPRYSLEGWRRHYSRERANVINFLAAYRAAATAREAQTVTAMDGYVSSIATIGSALNAARAAHLDGNNRLIQEPLTQTERNTLATVIETELE